MVSYRVTKMSEKYWFCLKNECLWCKYYFPTGHLRKLRNECRSSHFFLQKTVFRCKRFPKELWRIVRDHDTLLKKTSSDLCWWVHRRSWPDVQCLKSIQKCLKNSSFKSFVGVYKPVINNFFRLSQKLWDVIRDQDTWRKSHEIFVDKHIGTRKNRCKLLFWTWPFVFIPFLNIAPLSAQNAYGFSMHHFPLQYPVTHLEIPDLHQKTFPSKLK